MNYCDENKNLKGYRRQCFDLKEEMKKIEKSIEKLNEEKLDIIKKRDENNSLFKRKISELENLLEYERLDHEQNTIMYKQKMSV